MSRKHVIAYYMHESERDAALKMISAPEVTDAFVTGEMDDDDIQRARQEGLIVQTLPPLLSEQEESSATGGPDTAAMMMETLGVDVDAAVPAVEDYYMIRLRGPLI